MISKSRGATQFLVATLNPVSKHFGNFTHKVRK